MGVKIAGFLLISFFLSYNTVVNITYLRSSSDITEQRPLWSYKAEGAVRSVSISEDGKYIAAGTEEGFVYILNSSGKIISKSSIGLVLSVSISADGRYTVAGSAYNRKAFLFNSFNGSVLWSTQMPNIIIDHEEYLGQYCPWTVSISEDGSLLGIAVMDFYAVGYTCLLNGTDGKVLWQYPSGITPYNSISRDGSYLVSRSENGIYFFEKSGKLLWRYNPWANEGPVAVSGNGLTVVGTNGFWYLAPFRGGDTLTVVNNYDSPEETVYVFDKNGTLLFKGYTMNGICSVSISYDGRYIAAGSVDTNVYVYDRSINGKLWNFTTKRIVLSVSLSSDGDLLAAGCGIYPKGGGGGIVYLFNVSNGQPLWYFQTSSMINSLAISGDGNYIVAGSGDGYIYFLTREVKSPPPYAAPDNTLIIIIVVIAIPVMTVLIALLLKKSPKNKPKDAISRMGFFERNVI